MAVHYLIRFSSRNKARTKCYKSALGGKFEASIIKTSSSPCLEMFKENELQIG